MKRFEPYPIHINHPGTYELIRQRQLRRFAAKGDTQMVTWLKRAAKPLYATIEDKTPDLVARKYEEEILRLLRLILGTKVGKLLLDSLDKRQQYWIVPLDAEDKAMCNGCAAYTFPEQAKHGGGIRVYFNPADFKDNKWETADDILFHELVHAYRFGRVGYHGMNRKAVSNYDDAEEFLALQMQNVYLAHRGSASFYRSYSQRDPVTKAKAYESFVLDPDILSAFRHFVDRDPLVATVAAWRDQPNAFNPWRDQPALEQAFLRSTNGAIKRLPPF